MFTIVLYAYSRDIYSTPIEEACADIINFKFLLQDSKLPNYYTTSKFLNKIETYPT